MCGIVAILNWTAEPSLERVQRGLGVLRHRGPDGAQTWQSPAGHVCLGHSRLRVMDPATGDQPLSNENGTIHAIVNGEFYDFEETRAELESLGHRFRTRSDSEILLHLYEEFGAGCVNRLRGEYAFVLWDERNQQLLAVRDRFGIKPLFYSEVNGTLFFASEVKALHAAGVEAAWDEAGLLEKIALDISLNRRTLFRQVTQLPPAHYMVASRESITIHQYWDFDYPRQDEILPERSDDEHAEQFLDVLERAVRTRLRADVPVACYLSGGIDSSTILSLMARHSSDPVHAFAVSFDHPDYDESALARDLAIRAGAHFVEVPLTQAGLAAKFHDAVWHGETLFTNAHCIAKFALSEAARDAGFKVVLTGEGADEILGGYSIFVKDAVRHGSEIEREALRNSLGMTADDFSQALRPNALFASPEDIMPRLGYVPAWFEGREWILQQLQPILPSTFRSGDLYSRLLDELDLPGQLAGRHILNQSLYLNNKTVLPNYNLTVLGDRMEMAHSVEARLPFLDHHLVEFTRQLPVSLKIRGMAEKFVLRKAMRQILPPSVCGRRKHSFQAPPALLKPGEPLHELMQDTLRGSALKRVPFFNGKAV
ncbi:MAG TPA: asparagine synthase (glutamine-hydrolyzing), partial [Bryobacteraceae bacterium]|nr:asparagine synthase (glutamine-hydrolyzing) [Bryobacteraceae bacterium]